MSFNIIPTAPFEKEIKHLARKYPTIKKDIALLAAELEKEPKMGTPLGNDCDKIRLAITSKGKGKSGGARLITYVRIVETNIFLLAIYDKSEAVNISNADLKERLKRLK